MQSMHVTYRYVVDCQAPLGSCELDCQAPLDSCEMLALQYDDVIDGHTVHVIGVIALDSGVIAYDAVYSAMAGNGDGDARDCIC